MKLRKVSRENSEEVKEKWPRRVIKGAVEHREGAGPFLGRTPGLEVQAFERVAGSHS